MIAEWLQREPFLLLDGALATEIEKRGYSISDPLWSAVALYRFPEVIQSIHLSYLRAGSEIITAASYQATVEGFMKKGFSKKTSIGLMKKAIELADMARQIYRLESGEDRPVAVAASIGPYGAYLADGSEYKGHYGKSREELAHFHRERMHLLWDSHPDLLACETIPCLLEAEAIGDILPELSNVEAWISFSCKDGHHTCSGDWIRDCAAALQSVSGVGAIGVNCTNPLYIESLIRDIRKETDIPVIVYPNSGEVYDGVKKCWTGHPVDFSSYGATWLEAGARLIGGCCRTGPFQIQRLAALKSRDRLTDSRNHSIS